MEIFQSQRSKNVAHVDGFTLIELTIVMVLLVILSGAAVTSIHGLKASQENVAATRVRTVLVHAQRWAMGSGNNTYAVVDVANDLIQVFVDDPSKPGKKFRQPLSDPLTRSPMVLQLGADGVGIVAISLDGNELWFNAAGAPSDSKGALLVDDFTLSLTGGSIVSVTKNTGLVRVK
ncbi:MAG: type II secretion system protein [Planctomycetes bacterium]|nr:type II secretion system protein [Planctomycetota bacterium]